MSEAPAEPVDVNSKTSLGWRLWALWLEDAAKMKSLTPWISAAAMVWYVVYPVWLAPMATQAKQAEVTNLESQLLQVQEASRKWESTAKENKLAYDASNEEAAALRLKLDEALAVKKPEIVAPEPAKHQEASLETPVIKAKVKKVPVTKKDDPSTWEQFVAWYEKNVGTPGAP